MRSDSTFSPYFDIPCLLIAQLRIKDELKSSLGIHPNPKEFMPHQKLLLSVHKKLDDLLNQNSWFSHLSDFKENTDDDKTLLTQKEVIKIMKERYLISLNHTYQEVKNIKEIFQKYIKITSDEKPRNDIFTGFIESSLDATLRMLKEDRFIEEEQVLTLNSHEKILYDKTFEHVIYQLANKLHGRFIPFNQNIDPLQINRQMRELRGNCFGDVEAWLSRVITGQSSLAPVAADYKVFKFQLNQHEIKHSFKLCFTINYINVLKALCELSEFFKNASATCYSIYFKFKTRPGHSVSFRKILNTGEIEFRDPNFGVFVFPSMQNFKWFFQDYFVGIYFDILNGSILIYDHSDRLKISNKDENMTDKLPVTFSPSLPFFTNDYSKEIKLFFRMKPRTLYAHFHSLSEMVINKIIDEKIYNEQLIKEIVHQELSLRNQLLTYFYPKNSKILPSNIEIAIMEEKKAIQVEAFRIQQTKKVIALLQDKKISKSELKVDVPLIQNIITTIESSTCHLTLLSVINHFLNDKPMPDFLKDFAFNYEMHYGSLMILQLELISKLAELIISKWPNEECIPEPFTQIRTMLQIYSCNGANEDIISLFQKIKESFASIKFTEENIMSKIVDYMNGAKADNPRLLLKIFKRLIQFEEENFSKYTTPHSIIKYLCNVRSVYASKNSKKELKAVDSFMEAINDYLYKDQNQTKLLETTDTIITGLKKSYLFFKPYILEKFITIQTAMKTLLITKKFSPKTDI